MIAVSACRARVLAGSFLFFCVLCWEEWSAHRALAAIAFSLVGEEGGMERVVDAISSPFQDHSTVAIPCGYL